MSVMDRLAGRPGDAARRVAGAQAIETNTSAAAESARPLDARWEAQGPNGGWTIRLPVRAEDVRMTKQTVVAERVLVRIRKVEDVAHVTAQVRHEELKVNNAPVDETRPGDADRTVRWPVTGEPDRDAGASYRGR